MAAPGGAKADVVAIEPAVPPRVVGVMAEPQCVQRIRPRSGPGVRARASFPRRLGPQELTYGGLKPAYQARLDAMIEGTDTPNGRSGRRPRHEVNLLEGTKLVREWREVLAGVLDLTNGLRGPPARVASA